MTTEPKELLSEFKRGLCSARYNCLCKPRCKRCGHGPHAAAHLPAAFTESEAPYHHRFEPYAPQTTNT